MRQTILFGKTGNPPKSKTKDVIQLSAKGRNEKSRREKHEKSAEHYSLRVRPGRGRRGQGKLEDREFIKQKVEITELKE